MQALIGFFLILAGLGMAIDYFEGNDKSKIKELQGKLEESNQYVRVWQERFYSCENSKLECPITYAALKESKPEKKMDTVEPVSGVYRVEKSGMYAFKGDTLERIPSIGETVKLKESEK
tara:strand:+ start:4935 stop:5291 length:357 start_codon:yes stop_codon:yes gene_type:complete